MTDLDTYFERIGFRGPREPTLETLSTLHRLHPSAIPFENLDPLLGRPVRLDADSLQLKLVRQQRGGYCYEHNLLFARVLRALGFRVIGLAARVLWNAPDDDAIRPRSHMLLRVDIDGTGYVADVGFGGLTLTAPLRLDATLEQQTQHEPFRLVRTGDELLLQARLRDAWKTLYRFGGEAQLDVDYEVASWYTSTYPSSIFVTSLMVARVLADRRYAMLNDELAVHHLNGPTERRVLSSTPEVRTVLEETFGIRVPDDPKLEPALQGLLRGRAD
jgi:N-hydroxyarylamine O-acetyltransferase